MDQQILEQAAAWQASMSGDAPDFEGFVLWLEASEAHRLAYDQLTMLDDIIEQHSGDLHSTMPANDDGEARINHWRWISAVAAVVLLGLVAVPFLNFDNAVTDTTAVGETRQIALGEATSIALDADSAIITNRGDDRSAELLRGRAHFDVTHDASRPFTVDVGQYQVRDLGTRFDIRKDGDDFVVEVAEGSVSVDGNGLTIQAVEGERISVNNGKAKKSQIDSASVATWREGRLVYQGELLTQVIADINRYSKKKVALDPALAGQRFSGVLIIGDGSQLARNVADLMGLSLEVTETGERLVRH
jgi:transmembrane sensor